MSVAAIAAGGAGYGDDSDDDDDDIFTSYTLPVLFYKVYFFF